jgi:hypothetical protein
MTSEIGADSASMDDICANHSVHPACQTEYRPVCYVEVAESETNWLGLFET